MSKVVMCVVLLSSALVACRHPELPLLSDGGGETVDAPGGCTGSASECGADNALYQCDETSGHLTKVQDCQHGCSVDHCKECEPNTTSCNGDDLVMCDSSGTIVNPMTCANGCQAQECNTCKPGVSSCDGSGNAVTCGLDGKPGTPQACGAAGCISGVCNSCTPNSVTCQGDTLVTCGSNGMVQGTTACTLGCGTSPNAHCKVFQPSYGLSLPTGTLPDLAVDNPTTLNIQDCANSSATLYVSANGATTTTTLVSPQVSTVAQTGGPPICVVRFGKITVASGVTLNISTGGAIEHLLSLQATGDVSIAGSIIFKDLYGGPAKGGDSIINENTTPAVAPGAGGGGGVRVGGNGGTCSGCAGGGVGGAAISNIRSVLNRGSQGGSVTAPFFATVGGTAGGAIHLLSLTRVTVTSTGKLILNGGGAIGRLYYNDRAGAGGSGGTLVIEAPNVTFSASALAVANGGGGMGGCTVCTTDFPPTCTHANGENGQLSFARAQGGNCNGPGNGGWEATGDAAANGASATGSASAGGGGGSQGFIFLRGKTGANVMVTNGAIISPQPTIEAVTAN
jgi:hypothetical protein